jgi:general secretion pathway protein D
LADLNPLLRALSLGIAALTVACAAPPAPPISNSHLQPAPALASSAPEFATAPPLPPPPRVMPKQEVYSVVMQNVNVQDLLFALARDARIMLTSTPALPER